MKINIDTLKDHPWITVGEPQDESEIIRLEKLFNRPFPALMRKWLLSYGIVAIDESPIDFLFILLGISETLASDYSSIITFNYPDNPSRPDHLLIIAHEFDGNNDFYYALGPKDKIYSMKNHFAPYNIKNKSDYHDPPWQITFNSVEEFWDDRLGYYLNLETN